MTGLGAGMDIIGFLILATMIGLIITIIIYWVFFDYNNPRNKQIVKGKAPSLIEITWIIPAILVAIYAVINSAQIIFLPLLFVFLLVRLYLVRLYELINPDWETDGTSTGIPTLEKIGDALNKVPSPSELEHRAANIAADMIVDEYQEKSSLFHRMLAPIIGFHKRNHKKKWFIFYIYFFAIFILIPLAIVLLFLELIVREALVGIV